MAIQSKFTFKSKKSLADTANSVNNKQEDDPRFLPYYQLKPGEVLRVVFVPLMLNDEDMTHVMTLGRHGTQSRMKLANGVDRPPYILCNAETSNGLGRDCPVCEHKMELYKDYKAQYEEGTISKDEWNEMKKALPNRLNSATDQIMACVVVSSPFELKKPKENSDIYLVKMPQKAYESLDGAITNGDVDEQSIFSKIFEIHCKKNEHGSNDYSLSKFAYKDPTDAETKRYEEAQTDDLYFVDDILSDEKIAPKLLDSEEAYDDWLESAYKAINDSVAKEAEKEANKTGGKSTAKAGLSRHVEEKLRGSSQVEDDPVDENQQEEPTGDVDDEQAVEEQQTTTTEKVVEETKSEPVEETASTASKPFSLDAIRKRR